jgi:O-antigen ligase
MLIPLALDRLWAERRRVLKVAAAYSAAVMAATVVFTFSRGAAVALAVVVVMMLVAHPPSVRAVGAIVIAAAVALPFLPDTYLDRLSTLTQVGSVEASTDVSIRSRTAEVGAAVEMFLDHPIAGIGYGTFEEHYGDYTRDLGIEQVARDREAHNLYLEIAAETGVVGLAAFGALVLAALVSLRRAHRRFSTAGHDGLAKVAYAITAAFIGYLVTSIFLHMDFARTIWVLLGVALVLPRLEMPEATEPEPRLEAAWH